MNDRNRPTAGEPTRDALRQVQLRAATGMQAAKVRGSALRTSGGAGVLEPASGRERMAALLSIPTRIAEGLTARPERPFNSLFTWIVVLPTLLSIVYFAFLATDIFVSESAFVVRTPQGQSQASGLGAILQGTGMSGSVQDDTYAVQSYILSMDAVKALDERFDLRAKFGAESVDLVRRFGGLLPADSLEKFQRYYSSWVVDADVDSSSSLMTLTVRAFSSDDAYQINEALVNLAEDLINKMNFQARQDTIGFAEREVGIAEQRIKDSGQALFAFRSTNEVMDPERQAGLEIQQSAQLKAALVSARTQLAQLLAFAPDNPQVPYLRKQIESVQREVDAQTTSVVGEKGSLARKSANYDKVALEREFAGKQLVAAQAFLEQARSDAMRKQLYLARVVQPSHPAVALEPRRIKGVIATFMMSGIVWLILILLLSGVREHSD